VIVLVRRYFRTKYVLETWLQPNEEICVLTLDTVSSCPEYELETWLAPSEEICVLALELQSTCAKYALETWLVQTAACLWRKCTRPNWRVSIMRYDCYPNILNIETNASNKYVCTIYSLILRPLHIYHIKPRILPWNFTLYTV